MRSAHCPLRPGHCPLHQRIVRMRITYFVDPNYEWEEEVEETKHGGS